MGQSVCIIVILVNSKAGEPTSFKNAPNKKAGIGFFYFKNNLIFQVCVSSLQQGKFN